MPRTQFGDELQQHRRAAAPALASLTKNETIGTSSPTPSRAPQLSHDERPVSTDRPLGQRTSTAPMKLPTSAPRTVARTAKGQPKDSQRLAKGHPISPRIAFAALQQ